MTSAAVDPETAARSDELSTNTDRGRDRTIQPRFCALLGIAYTNCRSYNEQSLLAIRSSMHAQRHDQLQHRGLPREVRELES